MQEMRSDEGMDGETWEMRECEGREKTLDGQLRLLKGPGAIGLKISEGAGAG